MPMPDFSQNLASNLKVFKYTNSDNRLYSLDSQDLGVFSKSDIAIAGFTLKHSFENMRLCQSANATRICYISEICKRPCVFSFSFVTTDCAYTYLLSPQEHLCPDVSKQLEECRKVSLFLDSIKNCTSQNAIFTINECLSKHINQLLQLKRLLALNPNLYKENLQLNQLTKAVCDYANRLYKGKVFINANAMPVTAVINPEVFSGILMYALSQFVSITDDFQIDVDINPLSASKSTLCISTSVKNTDKLDIVKSSLEYIFENFCQRTDFDISDTRFTLFAHFSSAKSKEYKVGTPKYEQKLYDIENYKDALLCLSYVFSVSE